MKFKKILFIFIYYLLSCSDNKTTETSSAFTEVPNSFTENQVDFEVAKFNLENQKVIFKTFITNMKDKLNSSEVQSNAKNDNWLERTSNFDQIIDIVNLISLLSLAYTDEQSYTNSKDQTIELKLPEQIDSDNKILEILSRLEANNIIFYLRLKDYSRIEEKIETSISLYDLFYKTENNIQEKSIFQFSYTKIENLENQEVQTSTQEEFELIFEDLTRNIDNIKDLYKTYINKDLSINTNFIEIFGGLSLVFGKDNTNTKYYYGLSSNGSNIIEENDTLDLKNKNKYSLLAENGLSIKGCFYNSCSNNSAKSILQVSGGTKLLINIDYSNNEISSTFTWGDSVFLRFFIESFEYELSYIFKPEDSLSSKIKNFTLLSQNSNDIDMISETKKIEETNLQMNYLKNKLVPNIVYEEYPNTLEDYANNIIGANFFIFNIISDILE